MWWFIALWVVSAVAVYFLMPKPEVAKPPEVEEVDIPVVEDGKTIPVLFGTRNTGSFNVVWWGDVATVQFNVSGGESTWLIDVEDVHGGYYYFVGIHAILFHGPIDSITFIQSDDKTVFVGENTGGAICDLGSKDLYGGKESGGGFGSRTAGEGVDWPTDGCLEILMGESDQERNWYLEHNLDGGDAVGDTGAHEVPAFRGVVSAVLNRVYIGTSPNLRKLMFRGERVHTRQDGIEQWYDAKAALPGVCHLSDTEDINSISIFIAIDKSASMEDGLNWIEYPNLIPDSQYNRAERSQPMHYYAEFEVVQGLLDELQTRYIDEGITVHINITSFHYTAYPVTKTNANADDIIALKAHLEDMKDTSFVQLNTEYGELAETTRVFFSHPLVVSSDRKVFLMFTDGVETYGREHSGHQGPISDFDWCNNDPDVLQYGYGVPTTGATLGAIDHVNTVDTAVMTLRVEIDTNVMLEEDKAAALGRLWPDLLSSDSVTSGPPDYVDMNPAHIIRECLTDPDWGNGGDELSPDENAFVYAANMLYAEGMGVSIKWVAQTTIDDFIDLIKKHINAELYPDHSTGKNILKLIRDDYDTGELLILGEDDIVTVDNAKRPLIGGLVNSVTVQYWDTCTGKDASVTVVDQSLVQMQGSTINTTIQYPGFTNKPIATRAATRDLRVLSTQLLSCTVYAKRTAEALNLGSVFIMQWPDLEIDNTVMRVQGVDFGDGRKNTIRLDVVEDVFSLPVTGIVDDDDSDPSWTDPKQSPIAVDHQIAFEAPYYELSQAFGTNNISDLLVDYPDLGYAMVGAVRAGNAINAQLITDDGSGYKESGLLNFCGSLVISSGVDEMETIWDYETGTDIGLIPIGGHAQIDNELVRVDAIDTTANTITVGRGALDSSPRKHAIQTRVYAWDFNHGLDNKRYTNSDTISAKVLPVTGVGVLPSSSARTMVADMNSRAIRPYPPADFKMGGVSYPLDVLVDDGTLDLSWAHRDRVLQADGSILDHTDASIGPEAGTTYEIFVYSNDGVLKTSDTGITGSSFDVNVSGLSGGGHYVELHSRRDGYASNDFIRWSFSLVDPPGAVQYWRIWVDAGNGDSYTQITEMEMRGSIGGSDLCSGGTSSAHTTLSGYPADNAFDGSLLKADSWITESGKYAPTWLQYEFLEDTKIAEISISTVQTGEVFEPNRMPRSFTIQFSPDGVNWNVAGEFLSETSWLQNTSREFVIDSNVEAKSAWRVNVSANDGDPTWLGISEIEMHVSIGGVDQCVDGVAISDDYYTTTYASSKAFDGSISTEWLAAQTPHWISYTFTSVKEIVEISITSTSSGARAPKDFTLEYYDGTNWTVAATFTGETGWGYRETRTFTV